MRIYCSYFIYLLKKNQTGSLVYCYLFLCFHFLYYSSACRSSHKKETSGYLECETYCIVMARSRLACVAQTHFRSSLLSLRKIAIFRRERSDIRKCVCASQASSRCEPDVSPLTSLWHHTKFRRILKTVAYKMGSFWIYNINQLQDSRKKKIKVIWAKLHFLTKRTGWKNGTALYENVWEQQKSTGNEKTFSSKTKFYSFYLKLEWTKLDVQNLRLLVILGQKSGVFA